MKTTLLLCRNFAIKYRIAYVLLSTRSSILGKKGSVLTVDLKENEAKMVKFTSLVAHPGRSLKSTLLIGKFQLDPLK